MKRFVVLGALVCLLIAGLGNFALGSSAWATRIGDQGGRPLTATLAGAPGASGSATVTVNPGQGEVCYQLTVTGLTGITAAHIHIGAAGTNGPIVVPFVAPVSGFSSGCTSVSRELAKAILQNPSGYYINVHTVAAPAGAIRGQLSK
jgi:hypothetical protein